MPPITITGIRHWVEDGKTRMECFCNGFRVFHSFLISENQSYNEFKKEMLIEALQDSCKFIKLYGVERYKNYNKEFLENFKEKKYKIHAGIVDAIRECPLPEWDA